MPLHIIRDDITNLKCDAIVNAANSSLLGGGGVDGAIHKKAGPLLLEECKTLNGCKTGDAKITKGYNLQAKYIIHTVGPRWQGGMNNERKKLESCYQKSLNLAKEYNVTSIAFPLISSGIYGYPKQEALEVAQNVIKSFLEENEMEVYIVIFDKASFEISKNLCLEVEEFINDSYEGIKTLATQNRIREVSVFNSSKISLCDGIAPESDIIHLLENMDETFPVMLLKLLDAKNMDDVKCYKKANVSKQTWYKIMNEKNYKPSKNTVISFAIALELSLDEAKKLLKTVGFTLSRSNKFDIIIEYFLTNEIYDIFLINDTLFKFDQVCLGVN